MTIRADLSQAGLLQRLRKLVEDADEAGYASDLGFDLDGILDHYARHWKIQMELPKTRR